MNYRNASNTDLHEIQGLLSSSNLPWEDCAAHLENFIIFEENSYIIGIGGLEICGTFGLVRSIAVVPAYRGKGIAKKIYQLIEDKTYSLGINTLYLLTESATDYFIKLGFSIKNRDEVPVSVMESKQFKEICPSSATVMCREISDRFPVRLPVR